MEYVKLKEICEIKKGKKIIESKEIMEGSVRYIQIDDLRNNNNVKYCLPDSSYVYVEKRDLIIAWDGANAGTVGFNLEGAIGSTLAKISVIDSNIFEPFLALYLQSKFDYLQRTATGATIPHISRQALENINIPLVSIEEQKSIYNILSHTKELISKRQSQIVALDELTESIFLEMFGDPVLNTKKWLIKPFDEFAIIDTNMTKDFDEYAEMYHIGIDNIEKNTGKLINLKMVKDSQLTSGKYIFNEQHIIYSKIRPYLNKVALPNFKGLCSADAYPVLAKNNICNRYFLAYLLRSNSFLRHVSQNSDRTNIPKVNKNQLKSYRGILPPIDLQQAFEKKVLEIELRKELLLKALIQIEILYNSLLQKAFKGE